MYVTPRCDMVTYMYYESLEVKYRNFCGGLIFTTFAGQHQIAKFRPLI